jgi:DNA repair protein RecO (recombination protein O)
MTAGVQDRVYSVDAITLRRTNLGEKDRIVTLFTRERGKLSSVAKGARGPKSRLAGLTEPFTNFRGQLSHGQSLQVLTQGEVRNAYLRVRRDLFKVAYASHCLEIVDAGTAEQQPLPELWDLLAGALNALDDNVAPDLVTRAFELHSLRLFGFRPALDRCAVDGMPVNPPDIAFHPLRGGMLCADCADNARGAVSLSPAALELLKRLSVGPLAPVLRAESPESVRRELARCMVPYVRHHLDAPLRSLDILEGLQ